MYFSQFPFLKYSLDGGATNFIIRDIFRRIKTDSLAIQNDLAYYNYIVRDGDTPEILADKIYDNTQFHWVILIVNEIIDPRWDWILPENVLYAYIVDKYGRSNINSPHHYVNAAGYIVNSTTPGRIAVSNYDYEVAENEKKREIKILKPEYLNLFVKSFAEVATQ